MDVKENRKKRVTYSGNFCQAPGCGNESGRDKKLGIKRKYHRIPADPNRRKAWLKAIPRESWDPKPNERVCSDHFAGGSASHVEGTPGYTPSIFKGADKLKGKQSPRKRKTVTASKTPDVIPETSSAIHKIKGRKKRRLKFSDDSNKLGRPSKDIKLDEGHTGCHGDHDYLRTTKLHYVQNNIEHLQTQLKEQGEKFEAALKLSEAKNISLDTVKDFQLWTGFPNRAVFDALVLYLGKRGGRNMKYWYGGATDRHQYHKDIGMINKPGPDRKMSFEEELFLVIVKLKTGYDNIELAHLFGISDTVVGRIFTTIINFLMTELRTLFEMTPLDEEGVADCFKRWDNLKVVLDCTELAVERSTSLTARKIMYSNYKGKDTVKFGVSLARNLCVNFVTKAYGGRASDKFITMDSKNMLDALPQGTTVMTDRGFNVGEELKELGVKLIIPTFKGRNRTQLTEKELNSSENIAMARIHVERIIQRIRTYKILHKVVKLSSKDIIEQMFTVCAYLTNFQTPIIKPS